MREVDTSAYIHYQREEQMETTLVVTIKVDSMRLNKQDNWCLQAFVPGITNQYPIPLNLTTAQGEYVREISEKTEYENVKIQRGNLKEGKDGTYANHYYWDVAVFEGIENEMVADKPPTSGNVATKTVPVRTATPRPENWTKSKEPFLTTVEVPVHFSEMLDTTGRSIIRQVAFKAAVERTNGSPENVRDLTDQYERILLNLPLDDDKPDVGPEDEEPIFDYPEPPKRVTMDEFNDYCMKAGWGDETIRGWVGDPMEWLKKDSKRNYRKLLRYCRDQAIEEGLTPPEDFRAGGSDGN